MEVWKIIFLSKWAICRFHVNLPGCTPQKSNIIYQELSYSKGTTFEQNNIILNIYVSFRGCITILSLRCWEKIVLLISLPCQSMQFPVLHYSRRKSSISRTYQDTLGFLLDLQKLTQMLKKEDWKHYTPQNKNDNGKSLFSIGKTSSNGWFSIVMVVSGRVFLGTCFCSQGSLEVHHLHGADLHPSACVSNALELEGHSIWHWSHPHRRPEDEDWCEMIRRIKNLFLFKKNACRMVIVIILWFSSRRFAPWQCYRNSPVWDGSGFNQKKCLARDCSMPSRPLVLATVLNRLSSTNFHHLRLRWAKWIKLQDLHTVHPIIILLKFWLVFCTR